ncbi:glycoside hydrolase family 13 protein [Bacillus sp. FJAT-42376]|uniref:glycoside hydrolase family 13 protein n=1 Tax=Bacillus sp. FJAT-42376 TaxID=2014076 RepID=UPI000F4D4F29|nr:glycoside hydrolase family 13 protein [Bacillus sp. FJAT-42376]AZB41020.1 glycoside hydrolase family 13 protein [Bacillus sp. FJAT-42376]
MNKHAIYHIPDIPYAYPKNRDTLKVRLRAASSDLQECRIYYKDRYDWTSTFKVKKMDKKEETELFAFYEADLSLNRNRYRYYFELTDKRGNILFFDERGFREGDLKQNEATAFQYAYIAEADVYDAPEWHKEAVVYQIFPDRFHNGNPAINPPGTQTWGSEITASSMFGGDLQGIIDKMDYLEDLGINVLYMTPVFPSSSNHKYNTADYFSIDPQFGTLETAKELIQTCHEKGIKVIFDAVFNHTGHDFFAFQDLLENQEKSRYKDWYFADSFPVSEEKVNYYTFAENITEMPKLNTSNPEVRDYLLKVAEFWVKEAGIDGWRLDVSDEVDHEFWRAFKKTVKAANPDAVIIGEIMHEASSFLKGDQMDSIMNYPFKGAVTDFFAKREITAEQFDDILAFNRTIYMEPVTRQMWNLVGSHDTKRFLTECGEREEAVRLAAAFQFAYMGVPYIYYGDEIGLSGGEEPQSRNCMVWDEKERNSGLLTFFKQLIAIRKTSKALTHGSYKTLYSKGSLFMMLREWENERFLAVFNNGDSEQEMTCPISGQDVMTGEKMERNHTLKLKPMSFKWLKAE